MRESASMQPNPELRAVLDRFSKARIAVVGDLVADEYVYGETERISREAPVLIVRYESGDVKLGCAANAVANLCAHTDDVLFSSTPGHFKEISHLNVRPPEYWAEQFARHGLYRDVDHDPTTYLCRWAVRL